MQPPLNEYPNPQFQRDSYLSLNGYWDYKITKNPTIPEEFDGKILVPYSPEVSLSGVNHLLMPDEYLFYKLEFSLPIGFTKDLVYIHFLAVDQTAEIYLNGVFVGKHTGGYLPFSFEIKDKLKDNNILLVKVRDVSNTSYHSRGKQSLQHGGIWYTPQSGIWLPVYLESVPFKHVEKIKITPNIDEEEVIINVTSKAEKCLLTINKKEIEIETNKNRHIKINHPHLWSPENPYLYPLKVQVGEDKVSSYFAMRKFSIIEDNNIRRIALNNKPIFMKGVLDQGYYQAGYLTPSSYDDYIKDIELAKSLGFNTIRKHIKIEVPRWYYECDKRGMIVWQDFVNGTGVYKRIIHTLPLFTHHHSKDTKYKKFYREDEEGRKEIEKEFKETIDYLYNFPCIALWTIFNEGWGQFDAARILKEMEELDKTRLFDHASGWHDQYVGDIKSLHVYFQKAKLPKQDQRCKIISEFGGLVLPIEGHVMKGNSVYKKFKNPEKFIKNYGAMIYRDIFSNIPLGLSASIYTQLSDVEEETNGFITFDREVIKVDPKRIKEINDKLIL